jgi:hypothetical protein
VGLIYKVIPVSCSIFLKVILEVVVVTGYSLILKRPLTSGKLKL